MLSHAFGFQRKGLFNRDAGMFFLLPVHHCIEGIELFELWPVLKSPLERFTHFLEHSEGGMHYGEVLSIHFDGNRHAFIAGEVQLTGVVFLDLLPPNTSREAL